MSVPKIERLMGIEVYATGSLGIGGIIKRSVEDFVVEELLVDGSKAEVIKHGERQVLGSSSARNRYLLCVLVKRNWDTFIAVRNVAAQLGIDTGQIHIAGIKDAKAVTAQHVTIEGVSVEDVQKVKVKDIEIRPMGYVRNRLSAYYLLGNSFRITIGSIAHSKSTIQKRTTKTIEELARAGGAPNFFGHQRFGTTRPITHIVGKALIQGNFKKAALIYLAKPNPHEHPESRLARKELQNTQDFKCALKNFPSQLRYERSMLKHLAVAPNDFVGAFRRLPIKLRQLFVQAYQSYLFNRFLSTRVANGLRLHRAEVGDYVVNVERSGLPMLAMHKTVTAETLAEVNRAIKAGKMRLAIPLVGFRQHLSLGVQGEIEKLILQKEGIDPMNFKIRLMSELTTKGELRATMTPLISFSLNEIVEDSADPSKHRASVDFALYRGSYATVVLREIMKSRNPIKAGF